MDNERQFQIPPREMFNAILDLLVELQAGQRVILEYMFEKHTVPEGTSEKIATEMRQKFMMKVEAIISELKLDMLEELTMRFGIPKEDKPN